MGLFISTVTRVQFVAAQVAIITTFLPAFILSGFIFDIGSMPRPIQLLTYLVPAIILSGFSTPIANMPRVVQAITYADPLHYFLVVLRGTFLEGTSFDLLVDQFWPMALIAVLTLTSAGWLFRRRMYSSAITHGS